jgi:hypothetical protein
MAPAVLEDLDLQARPRSTAAELIGLVLLDLDRLASGGQSATLLPTFAIEFMDRRLAGRLAAQYSLRDVSKELRRRFDSALREIPKGRDAGYEALLARLERHVRMLEATTQLVRAD